MADKKISELDAVLQINNDAVFPISQDNAGEPTTFKAGITQLGAEIAEDMTFSNLQTTSKKIVGAINEIAQSGGGTTDYDDLENKPQINSVELSGNKSLDDLGIQPSEISKSASGSIATFTDGGDNIPVKSFECEIVAQQASGTPTPVSSLLITGFSQADIGDVSDATNITYFKGVLEGKYGFVDLGTLNWTKDTITLSVTVFRAPIDNREVGDLYGICDKYFATSETRDYLETHNMSMTRWNATGTNVAVRDDSLSSGSATDFTTAVSGVYLIYELATPTTPTITPEQFKSLCNAFGITSDMFIVSFGQTIYGGRLIYSNGQWAIEAGKAMTLISDLDWSYNESDTRFSAPDLSGIVKNSESTSIPLEGLSCECYENGVSGSSRQTDLSIAVNASGVMLLKDTNYTTKADLISAVGNYKIVYPLETPVIIPLTSSTRVKTVSGTNNIFSNTGDVSLEYFTEKADEIAELVEEEIASMSADYHAYSTDEQIVGRWIDGKPIYEKTFTATFTNIAQNTPQDMVDVSGLGIADIIRVFGSCKYDSTTPSVQPTLYESLGGHFFCYVFPSGYLQFSQAMTAQTTGRTYEVKVTIQYTKTSSNTRSLNLSKGIAENPIEEKTEEIKEAENEDTER